MPTLIEFAVNGRQYRLDDQLSCNGKSVAPPTNGKRSDKKGKLSNKALGVLRRLIEGRGDWVSVGDLRAAVWGEDKTEEEVTDGNVTHYVSELSRALDDKPAKPVFIGRDGKRYRFLPEFTVDGEAPKLKVTVMPPPTELRGIALYPADFDPSLHEKFVGREADLPRIHEALTAQKHGRAALVGLTHSGGFGKTRMAREYVWRYGEKHFPGGIVWIDAAADAESLERQHHEILTLFSRDTPSLQICREQKIDIRKRLGSYFQQRTDEEPVLAVVDNVPEPEGDRPARPFTEYCPGAAYVTVLATSRVDLNLLANMTVVEMDELEAAPAVALLTSGLHSAGELTSDQWATVAAWVGRLPLVLELLNAAMRKAGLRPREVHGLATNNAPLTAELDGISNRLHGSVHSGALRGVTMAFDAAYGKMKPELQLAARMAAHWGTEAIPGELVRAAPDGFADVAPALVHQSWIQPATGDSFGTMHRVIADFLRSKAEADDAQAAVQAVRAAWPDDISDPANWPAAERLWVHGQAAVGYAEANGVAGEDCWWVLEGLGSLARIRGTLSLSRQQHERGIKIAREKLGAEHLYTLTSMSNLADTMGAQGDLDRARRMQEEVLATFRHVLGAEHSGTLTSMNNLAVTMRAQGDLEGARKMQEDVLVGRRRVRGAEHPITLLSMSNLAETMGEQGDLDGARKMQEDVLIIQRGVLGGEHPDTLRSMNNLAATMGEQGDLDGTRKMQGDVLIIQRRVLGAEHPDTLRSMNNLAATMRAQGDLEGSRKMQEDVLIIQRRVLGGEHPNTSGSAWNLAYTLVQKKEHVEAERVARDNLFWLMGASEERLSAHQRKARDWAKRRFGW